MRTTAPRTVSLLAAAALGGGARRRGRRPTRRPLRSRRAPSSPTTSTATAGPTSSSGSPTGTASTTRMPSASRTSAPSCPLGRPGPGPGDHHHAGRGRRAGPAPEAGAVRVRPGQRRLRPGRLRRPGRRLAVRAPRRPHRHRDGRRLPLLRQRLRAGRPPRAAGRTRGFVASGQPWWRATSPVTAGPTSRSVRPTRPVAGAPTGFQTGEVVVLHGSSAGFDRTRAHVVARPSLMAEHFGEVLAAGDVDGDGDPDLVEGAAGRYRQWDADEIRPGHVTWAPGAKVTGPTAASYVGARPAGALAVGDVTGDGIDDIVAGVGGLPPLRAGRTDASRDRDPVQGQARRPGHPWGIGHPARCPRPRPGAGRRPLRRRARADRPGPRRTAGRGRRGAGQAPERRPGGRAARRPRRLRTARCDRARPGERRHPRARRRSATGSALRSRRSTSAATAGRTWRSALRGRTAARGTVTVIRTRGIFYVPSGVAAYSLESLNRPGGGPKRKFGSVLGG